MNICRLLPARNYAFHEEVFLSLSSLLWLAMTMVDQIYAVADDISQYFETSLYDYCQIFILYSASFTQPPLNVTQQHFRVFLPIQSKNQTFNPIQTYQHILVTVSHHQLLIFLHLFVSSGSMFRIFHYFSRLFTLLQQH